MEGLDALLQVKGVAGDLDFMTSVMEKIIGEEIPVEHVESFKRKLHEFKGKKLIEKTFLTEEVRILQGKVYEFKNFLNEQAKRTVLNHATKKQNESR